MTAIKDPAIGEAEWNAYRELLRQNKLDEHVFVLWAAGSTMDTARKALAHISALPKPPNGFGDDSQLISGGAKIFMDGSGGGRTAWLYKPWNKNRVDTDGTNVGYPATDPQVYREMVRMFHQAGVHVGTHAIGDRAIDWVVDTYAEVLKEKPTRGLRHSVIHANIPTDHAMSVMASLEKGYDAGYPEAQAPFMWWIGDTYAGNFGGERSQRLEPLKTWIAKGIVWGGGSDYPVTPYAARYGLWASIERETLKGVYGKHPFGTAESIDIHTALRSYTRWAARQLFLEGKAGSIEPGKDADIAVWDHDLYNMPAAEIKKSEVRTDAVRRSRGLSGSGGADHDEELGVQLGLMSGRV
jgi:predicted amidohydrolase YtcJ